jgi:hypothetical protein
MKQTVVVSLEQRPEPYRFLSFFSRLIFAASSMVQRSNIDRKARTKQHSS